MAGAVSARPIRLRRASSRVASPCLLPRQALTSCWAPCPPLAQTDFLTFPAAAAVGQVVGRLEAGKGAQSQMLVQADEIHYDHANDMVSAVGNVQMYYNGSTIEADKVIYNQKTKRLRAEGRIRLTEAGRQDHLRRHSRSERRLSRRLRRFASSRCRRTIRASPPRAPTAREGNITVMQSGVYTACEACKDDPKKPPLWQVKAARITHNEGEKMLYFQNASLEFFGMPIAYFPYFSAPDPTVKKKSGWLMPIFSSSSKYGFAAQAPYYWVLAPDRDVTHHADDHDQAGTDDAGGISPASRQRRVHDPRRRYLPAGQAKCSAATTEPSTPGYRNFRGSVESTGQFALNEKWVWGWDAVKLTDKTFFQDYNVSIRATPLDPFQTGMTEGTSQLYLTGKGDRSFFDIRAQHFYGYLAIRQSERAADHPSGDGLQIHLRPAGARRRTWLQAEPDEPHPRRTPRSIRSRRLRKPTSLCGPTTADPAVKNTSNCLLRGVPGTYSRFSAELNWKRSITDSFGQIFTPFAYLRADVASMDIRPQPGVSNYHRRRRKQFRARHAHHRHGISLPLHQRAVLGHADDRADRADHRAAQ